MRKQILAACCAVGILCSVIGQATAGEMRTAVRLTFLESILDIADFYDSLPNYEVDLLSPVGLSVSPAYEFDFGLWIWGDMGPIILMIGDLEFWCVPVSAGVGFSFLPSRDVSPYVKVGVRVPLADGDYVDSTSAGAVFLGGIEFMKQRKVGIVLEAGYDTSEISFGEWGPTKDITGGVTVSVGAVF